MKFYNLDTEITFGRFKGKTIEEVLLLEPSYFNFCILNLDHFFLSGEVIAQMKEKNKNFIISETASQKLEEKYADWLENKDAENEYYANDNYYEYGSSYKEYGGYNGWSDDVINDAFDGDPEMTWNVD
jgi:hypothetical protein